MDNARCPTESIGDRTLPFLRQTATSGPKLFAVQLAEAASSEEQWNMLIGVITDAAASSSPASQKKASDAGMPLEAFLGIVRLNYFVWKLERNDWTAACPVLRDALVTFLEVGWEDVFPAIPWVFSRVIRHNDTAKALELLENLGYKDRWRPLYEALKAIAAGTPLYLRRVAPEIRIVSEMLMKQMQEGNKTGA